MTNSFWHKLKKPIFILAPMAGITDTVFRRIVAKSGKPDVFYTEFVSCDGLCSPGRSRLLVDLQFSAIERPIVAQIFGSKPENFYKTAELAAKLGFDGIDINIGCPDKSVEKQGAGAALIRNPELTKEIVRATQRGSGGIPVSVKTRLGYDSTIIEEWTKHLLDVEPAAIAIHARTRIEMSKVVARWDDVSKAVSVRDRLNSNTLIIGNGDIRSLEEANRAVENYGVDGVMIGRGIIGNPWLFNLEMDASDISKNIRLQLLLEHAALFKTVYGSSRNFAIMRKFFCSYLSGVPEAKALRMKLMEATSLEDIEYHVAANLDSYA